MTRFIAASILSLSVTLLASGAQAAALCQQPNDPVKAMIMNMGKPVYDTDAEEMLRFKYGGPLLHAPCDAAESQAAIDVPGNG